MQIFSVIGAVSLLILCGQVQAQTTFRFGSSENALDEPAPQDIQAGYSHVRNTDGSVNYERNIEYAFAADSFLSPEWAAYAPIYLQRFDPTFHFSRPSVDACRRALLVAEPFQRKTSADPILRCLKDMRQWLHLEMVLGRRDGPLMKLFFEDLVPFLVGAPSRRWTKSYRYNVSWAGFYRDKSFELVWAFYGLYSDWYGVTTEMDAAVLSAFNFHETLNNTPISDGYFHCPPDIRIAPAYDGYITDSCGNYGAEKGLSFALLGLTLQESDLVNEAIAILQHIASHTTPEGGTVDAFRSGAATGYLMQGQTSLDPLAFLITHFTNVDAYAIGGGIHENTVENVIKYSIQVVLDPPINWKYAKANDIRPRECCHRDELWKRGFNPENADYDIVRQLSGWIQGMAGYSSSQPALDNYYRATRDKNVYPVVVYWNGPSLVEVTAFSYLTR